MAYSLTRPLASGMVGPFPEGLKEAPEMDGSFAVGRGGAPDAVADVVLAWRLAGMAALQRSGLNSRNTGAR
jgi:hypothetical protein